MLDGGPRALVSEGWLLPHGCCAGSQVGMYSRNTVLRLRTRQCLSGRSRRVVCRLGRSSQAVAGHHREWNPGVPGSHEHRHTNTALWELVKGNSTGTVKP